MIAILKLLSIINLALLHDVYAGTNMYSLMKTTLKQINTGTQYFTDIYFFIGQC